MSRPISVPADALNVVGASESLASLPATYNVDAAGGLRVGAVDGTDWIRRGLDELAKGRLGILAVPGLGTAHSVDLSALGGSLVPVVIADRWSHNSGVALFATALEEVSDVELVELSAHIGDDDIMGALLDLLVVADIVAGPIASLSVASVRPGGVNAIGIGRDSLAFLVSVRRSAVGSGDARLRAVGATQAADAVLPAATTAAPARVRMHNGDHIVAYPTVYESSHRAAWVALAKAVNAGSEVLDIPRRLRMTRLLERELLTQPKSKTGTSAEPANQEEKK